MVSVVFWAPDGGPYYVNLGSWPGLAPASTVGVACSHWHSHESRRAIGVDGELATCFRLEAYRASGRPVCRFKV